MAATDLLRAVRGYSFLLRLPEHASTCPPHGYLRARCSLASMYVRDFAAVNWNRKYQKFPLLFHRIHAIGQRTLTI